MEKVSSWLNKYMNTTADFEDVEKINCDEKWDFIFKELEQKQDGKSLNLMGLLYQNGYGVVENHPMALQLFYRAIDLGDINALCNLGYMYEKSIGVKRNKPEAIRLYQLAVDKQSSGAMYRLAQFNRTIDNNDEAVKLFQMAIALGDTNAMVAMANMYMIGQGVEKNSSNAFTPLKI